MIIVDKWNQLAPKNKGKIIGFISGILIPMLLIIGIIIIVFFGQSYYGNSCHGGEIISMTNPRCWKSLIVYFFEITVSQSLILLFFGAIFSFFGYKTFASGKDKILNKKWIIIWVLSWIMFFLLWIYIVFFVAVIH